MAVYHILADGSRPADITGHIVKIKEAEPLYRFLTALSEERAKGTYIKEEVKRK